MGELILTPSGARGVVGDSLTARNALDLSIAFGRWAGGRVIIGRDTRISGPMLEAAVLAGLLSQGCEVINCGIVPTPVIIHAKNKLGVKAGIIISRSHNPPDWNGLKLMSEVSFTSREEINEIKKYLGYCSFSKTGEVVYYDPVKDYIKDLLKFVKVRNTGIRVVLDTGAGAGRFVTPKVLEKLGCEVTLVNDELIDNDLPRNPEPVKENLSKLIELMKTGKYDIGFAHDCDADRLVIVGEDGTLYREDTGLAIIAKHEKKGKFVTNTASSLMFEEIMGRENVIRVPVGERNLAIKMKETGGFGGEGSCGGVMFPEFNNCRDGIFAAAKIVEIMSTSGRKINELVSELPVYYSVRKIVRGVDIKKAMEKLKSQLSDYEVVDRDVIVKGEEWFVLAHPSNTEPIIRVISEAKSMEKAEELARDFYSKII